jgi:hypothetical protein
VKRFCVSLLPKVLLALAFLWGGQSHAAPCDRACLDAFVDKYLTALERRDPATLPVATNVKFSENNKLLSLGEGAWRTVTSVKHNYVIRGADPERGQVGYFGVIDLNGTPSPFALRLKIVDGRIAEIETILPGKTLSPIMAQSTAKLLQSRPIFKENVATNMRSDRESLRRIANSYYEGIEQEDSHPVPFAHDCHRIENGTALTNNPDFNYNYVAKDGRKLPNFAALGCMDLANSGLFNADLIGARRYPIIDLERGLVFAYTFYQSRVKAPCSHSDTYGELCPASGPSTDHRTLVMLEIFKIESGQIKAMESIWTPVPQVWRSVWW